MFTKLRPFILFISEMEQLGWGDHAEDMGRQTNSSKECGKGQGGSSKGGNGQGGNGKVGNGKADKKQQGKLILNFG